MRTQTIRWRSRRVEGFYEQAYARGVCTEHFLIEG